MCIRDRVEQVAEQTLPQRRPRRELRDDLVRRAGDIPRLAGEQAADAEIAQVGRAGKFQDSERDRRSLEKDADAERGGEHPRQGPDGNAHRRKGRGARAAGERVANDQRGVWAWRDDKEGREKDESREPSVELYQG